MRLSFLFTYVRCVDPHIYWVLSELVTRINIPSFTLTTDAATPHQSFTKWQNTYANHITYLGRPSTMHPMASKNHRDGGAILWVGGGGVG